MSYENKEFNWDFDALKRFYEVYVLKWINVAVNWTEAQMKQARANLGFGNGDFAVGSDFTGPDATKRAKVPTVGAILDGLNDGVYDVSKRNPTGGENSDGKFTLEYILSHADTLIPTSWRHGGMTISFVDSSDNKYVQYLCNSQTFTTDVNAWEKMNLEEEISQLGQFDIQVDVALKKNGYNLITFEHGLINSQGIVDPTNTAWIYNEEYIELNIPEGKQPTWTNTPAYTLGLRYYDSNKVYLGNSYSSSAAYVRFVINISEIDYNIKITLSVPGEESVYYVLSPYKKVMAEGDIDPIQYIANFGGIKLRELKCGIQLSSIKKIRIYRAYNSISGFAFYDASDSILIDARMYFSNTDDAKTYFKKGFINLPQLKMIYDNMSDQWNIVDGFITNGIVEHDTPILNGFADDGIYKNEVIITPVIAETGKAVNNTGNVVTTSGSYAYTEPIKLAAGEIIRVFCRISSALSALSKFDNGIYKPLVIGRIDGTALYEYKADTDTAVVLSFNYSSIYYASICRRITNVTQEEIALVFTSNCYVSGGGIIFGTGANYGVSNPVKVYKGDIIDLTITANPSYTSVLNLSDFGGRNLISVQVATESRTTYTYEVKETGYIVVSGDISSTPANRPILKITHGEFFRNFNNTYKNVFGYEEFYRKKHFYVDNIKYIPEMYGTIHTYEGDSSVQSNHIVNAVAYPDGTIIACRDGGNVVKIDNNGHETTLLTISGASDWRGMFIDSNNNVYVSPHSSAGSANMSMSDRGLYKLAYGESQFVKVISLYDTSSDVETETQSNDDTIWTMCEDNMGNLYAGVYAHSVRANPAIYKSTDGGDTWEYIFNFIDAGLTPVDDPRGRPMHIHCIIFNPYDCALYCIIGEIETVFKSTNGGTAWVDLHTNTEDTKGTTLIGVPDGLLIGSDGSKEGVISKLYADGKTVKSVGRMWHAEFMGMRRSDVTGWIYAFTKIESTVVKTTVYPPYSANSSTEALNEWKGDVTPGVVKNWELYNSWVSKFYNHDAIHPCSAAILVSRDNGESWEIIWRKDCGAFANGIWCIGYFKNGECLCGVTIGDSSHVFTNPVIVKEGSLDYGASGVDLTRTIFGKLA